jgi:hypothetical protein
MYVNKIGNLAFAVITIVLMAATLVMGQRSAGPSIRITTIPAAGEGDPNRTHLIGGVAHADNLSDCKVVVYAHTDTWYVQPTVASPYTVIGSSGNWKTSTHPGAEYAALLVKSSFKPDPKTDNLPPVGGDVLAADQQPGK